MIISGRNCRKKKRACCLPFPDWRSRRQTLGAGAGRTMYGPGRRNDVKHALRGAGDGAAGFHHARYDCGAQVLGGARLQAGEPHPVRRGGFRIHRMVPAGELHAGEHGAVRCRGGKGFEEEPGAERRIIMVSGSTSPPPPPPPPGGGGRKRRGGGRPPPPPPTPPPPPPP